jgi:hypothetical protein
MTGEIRLRPLDTLGRMHYNMHNTSKAMGDLGNTDTL